MIQYKENILVGICGKLQLPPSKYTLAEERYKVISDTIQKDTVFRTIDLRMYPHGSFRLKTTVKPFSNNEYDLDFVVEIPSGVNMTPQDLYNHIYRILSSDGIHNSMLEKKSRCIRVNYANDFHMDIMPGQLVNRVTNEIIVPDRKLKSWYHHSNPIGYAEWFENQAKSVIRYELNKQRIAKGSAEPISDQEIVARLEPLRRAVQLVKRYRDVYCDKNNVEPVRSIVLCTLMGFISSSYSSEIDIITDFCTYVNGKIAVSNGEPFEVKNPVVDEVLTEKWTESKKNYDGFVKMMQALTDHIQKLKSASLNTDIVVLMKEMFGENLTNDVIKEQANGVNTARAAGTLGITATGVLNTTKTVTAVKKNTFYGE